MGKNMCGIGIQAFYLCPDNNCPTNKVYKLIIFIHYFVICLYLILGFCTKQYFTRLIIY